MHANKLITINWGHAESREFQLGHVNMFTGGSGSGKTTTADAFQTVMTAARQGVFAFNPGQNESTQRGKWGKQPRTLESYFLGAEEGGIYMRPDGAHGYIALSFIPSPGEPHGQPFSAVVAVSAHLEKSGQKRTPRRNRLHLIIIEDQEVELDDLITSRSDDGMEVLPVEQIVKQLVARYGADRVRDHRDNKISYLQHLYGVLRGRRNVSQDEALQAARAFSRFMAYHPVEDIDNFVKNEVLERRDLSTEVEHISLMMRDVGQLKNEAHRLGANINILQTAREHGNEAMDAWIEEQEQTLLQALVQERKLKQQKGQQQSRLDELADELSGNSKRIKDIDAQLRALEEKRATIDGERRQHDAARRKDDLERQIEELMQSAAEHGARLGSNLNQLKSNRQQLTSLLEGKQWLTRHETTTLSLGKLEPLAKELLEADLDAITTQLGQMGQASELNTEQVSALAQKLDGIDGLQESLQQWLNSSDDSLGSQIERIIGELSSRQSAWQEQRRTLGEQVSQIKLGGGIDYPRSTAVALDALQRQLPKANAKVLCDLIEVRDEQWQAAIEGYMGGNRFNLIVKPEFEAEAIRLLQKTQGTNAKVIQGSLAREDMQGRKLPADSIVRQLEIDEPMAEAYVAASYGNVQMVGDTEALRNAKRGLTQDGQGSANYAMFHCGANESDLTFGKSARALRLKRREEELNQLEMKLSESDNELARLRGLSRLAMAFRSESVEGQVQHLDRLAQESQVHRESINTLDMGNIQALDEALDEVKASLKSLDSERTNLLRGEGMLEQARSSAQEDGIRTKVELERAGEQVHELQREMNAILVLRKDYSIDIAVDSLREEAETTELELADYQKKVESLKRQQQKEREQFNNLLRDYNLEARPNERIDMNTESEDDAPMVSVAVDSLRALMTQIRRQLQQQKDSGLADVESRLDDAKAAVNNAFTASFCQRLYAAIEDGERTLRAMNEELEVCKFGDDKFSFGWEWVPHYKRYHAFFKAVMAMEGLGEGQDLFDAELGRDEEKVRDEIMSLLLSDDRQNAEARLAEIADYRNYRRYEIFKHTNNGEPIALSQYGTGSGGQLETPAYVIRAAAISSAFKFRDGDHHLRSVIIDESFAKMDEIRARAVIEYLTKTLNLQMLFIMPSKSAGAFKDMVNHEYVFSKVNSPNAPGELSTATFVNHLLLKQDAIKQAWEEYRVEVRKQAAMEFESGVGA